MADIEFTSDIKLNTDEAVKSAKSCAAEIEKIFSATAQKVNKAVTSGVYGFTNLNANYPAGISALDSIIKQHQNNLDLSDLKGVVRTNRQTSINAASAKLKNLRVLSSLMAGLAHYDTLYPDIAGLKKAANGNIESSTVLSKADTLQWLAGRNLSVLRKGHLIFPEIFGIGALELGELNRDTNRITSANARSDVRFRQKSRHAFSALDRAINYLWYSDSGLQELNSLYGLGISPAGKRRTAEKYLTESLLKETRGWVSSGLLAEDYRQRLASGDLTAAQTKSYRERYFKSMDKLIKGFEKAYPDQHEIANSLRVLRNETLGAGAPSPSQGGFLGILKNIGAGALVQQVLGMGFDLADTLIQTYGEEKVHRNAYYSEMASRQRFKGYSKLAGQIGGAIVGAYIGSALGGGAGAAAGGVAAAPGAAVGGATGFAVGGWAGGQLASLYPEWYMEEFKSDQVSSKSIGNIVRNWALYGSDYNTYFANGITELGIANGEAAMGGLADRAMGMRAKMMLGQVGEQEMLYMSMMPNYYAALMAGVTGPELMRIYQRDLGNIGDPSMRYLVGNSIGNTEAFAAVNNPYFSSFYKDTIGSVRQYNDFTSFIAPHFMEARKYMGAETMRLQYSETEDTFERGHPSFVVPPITVVVNVDGDEIKRDSRTSDEAFMEDLQLYTVGG